MADVVGQAVYELDLDAGKFTINQQKAEAQFKASQDRIDAAAQRSAAKRNKVGVDTTDHAAFEAKVAAALASQWGVTGTAVTTATTKAAAGTSKLTSEQRVLNNALRTSASQLAQQIPFARGLSSAFGAASVALPEFAGGILAAFLAFQVLDGAVTEFTGSGIIDHLTGEADAHEVAARAAKAQADAVEQLAAIQREGVSAGTARNIQLADQVNKAKELAAELDKAALVAQKQFAEGRDPDTQRQVFASVPRQFLDRGPLDDYNEALQNIANTLIKDDKPSYAEWLAIIDKAPDLGHIKDVEDALLKAKEAAGLAGAAMAEWELSITKALDGQKQFTSALADLQAIGSTALDPQLAALEREQTQLTQLKTKMGDAFGASNQARLDEVGRLIDLLKDKQDLVTQSVTQFGAEVQRQYGALAPAILQNVASALTKLSDADVVKIKILLPDLVAIKSVFANFIAALQAGANVTIAIRAASVAGFGTSVKGQSFLGGSISGLPGFSPEAFPSDAALDFEKKLQEQLNNLNNNSLGPLGATADKAAKHVLTLDEALADMVITADEMRQLNENGANLTAASVAALELQAEAQGIVTDARFREIVTLNKLAQLFPGLTGAEVEFRLGLAAIAQNLEETHRTAEQFQLDEWLKPKFDAVKSMIDEIFSKPTRESLTLELKKKKLEQQKLLLERGGADASNVGKKGTKGHPAPEASRADKQLASIDKQIEAVQREIDLRQNSLDILKIETELKDKTLQTDQDLLNANQFLGTALDSLSGSVKGVEDALGIRLFDAGLRAASALNAVGAAGGTGYTAAEKHWINGVALANGEDPPFPGFALGTLGAPQTSLALIHKGEPVLPPDVGDMFRDVYKLWSTPQLREVTPRSLTDGSSGGHSGPISIQVWANDDAEIMRKVNRALSDTLRVKKYGGSTPSNSASR